MGKKFLLQNGKEVEISEEEFQKRFPKAQKPTYYLGCVIEYSLNGHKLIGKITGKDHSGSLLIAKLQDICKSGYQFASNDYDKIQPDAILRKLE
jgi:hypothetical protein